MNNKGTVVVLGTFDGVHMGHRTLIAAALKKAKNENKECVVYTFSNHPLSLISKSPKLLMTAGERIAELENIGVRVVADSFNKTLANTQPLDFLSMLKARFNMTDAVAGFNYSFGKGGKGNVETLKKIGRETGFSVHITEPVLYKKESVSSSRIRNAIEAGDILNANAMLESEYALSGKVILNKRVGSKIGFPTANIEINQEKVLPKNGVYATHAYIGGKVYNAVTNIGTNPTVNGDKLTVETHIIGFDADIYGQTLKISFIERIRDDKKFNSIEELKMQIAEDTAYFS